MKTECLVNLTVEKAPIYAFSPSRFLDVYSLTYIKIPPTSAGSLTKLYIVHPSIANKVITLWFRVRDRNGFFKVQVAVENINVNSEAKAFQTVCP